MPPSASLVIPFETGKSRKPRNLLDDVQQIVKQKGAFRYVDEESLLAGIARPSVANEDEASDTSSDVELETIQETQKRLFGTRNELSRLYQTSLNEINTLQDLVSWLLSARSKVAVTTMSPALKGGVPVGSADLKIVPTPGLTQNAQRRLTDSSSIVRLQAFEKCSDKLLAASKRLDTEAQLQSKYWDQMAEVRSKGWPVSKLPRDGRSLVAHVASTEAAPRYRNRGLLPFRRNENGDLTIPDLQKRHLAVIIQRRGKVTGFYQSLRDDSGHGTSLEEALIRAKEAVFEEELFSEASRESQLIASMGAKVRSTSIEVDVTAEFSVNIAYAYSPHTSDKTTHSPEDDELAAFIGKSLRIMLVAEYENKHRARSQRSPIPMTLDTRSSPEYVLVRPVIAQLRHTINVAPLLNDLKAYQMSLTAAGLSIATKVHHNGIGGTSIANLQSLRQVTMSEIRVSLPTGIVMQLNVETRLGPPHFGTQFKSSEYRSRAGSRSLQSTSSPRAAAQFVADVIVREVCCSVLESKHGDAKWDVQTTYPLELILRRNNKPLAVLSASCHSGSLAISCRQVAGGVLQRVVYDKSKAMLILKNNQREETEKPLSTLIDEWTTNALN